MKLIPTRFQIADNSKVNQIPNGALTNVPPQSLQSPYPSQYPTTTPSNVIRRENFRNFPQYGWDFTS